MMTMHTLPTLDAHAHLDFARTPQELNESGAVLAMTLSLDEASRVVERREPLIAWGVGCHPRMLRHQQAFEAAWFCELVQKTPIVGEIGLDSGSRVLMELQLRTFRQALEVVAGLPRIVSIHSYKATTLVLKELRCTPIQTPILHGWTGSAAETSEAVALGCYFSIHSQVARQSKWRTRVPRERILMESDHGYADPPPAIPCRVGWVEYLAAQQYRMKVEDTRRLGWRNLARIVDTAGVRDLLPGPMVAILDEVKEAL